MVDVALRAQVSHQTVSRVLNGSVNVRPETRDRVLAAIDALGYRRNSAARALVTRKSGTVGVVAPASALYGPISTLIAVEEAAREAGYFVSMASVRDHDTVAIDRVLEHFLAQGVEGIVVIAPQAHVVAVIAASRLPVPVVLISAHSDLGAGSQVGGHAQGAPVISLNVDQRAGARMATDHLLGLGHSRVAHVAGPQSWFDARERRAGWAEALAAAGIGDGQWLATSWLARDGYEVGRRLCAEGPPTAVFAGNDQLALGLLRAFHDAGVAVPGEVSVVGFDDIAGADQFGPPLTTVRQPFGALGRRAVGLLMDVVAGVDVEQAPILPELVVRASSARSR